MRISSHSFGGQLTLQPSLVRNLVLLIAGTCAAIAAVVIVGSRHAVEDLSEAAIDTATRRTKSELDSFFRPVRTNLHVATDWAEEGQLGFEDPSALNRLFVPMLRANPQISSMLIADSDGREYLLLKSGDHWLNRLTDKQKRGDLKLWKKWTDDLELVEEWQEELDYDSTRRPWYKRALAADPGTVAWTAPYTFFTTRDPGITASSRTRAPDGTERVIAFDLMLMDISKFTTQLLPSPNGKVFVTDRQQKVIGLPHSERFSTDEAIRAAVLSDSGELGMPAFSRAITSESSQDETEAFFEFQSDGRTFWADFTDYELGALELEIAVLVPREDFQSSADNQRNWIIAISLAAVVFAILIGIFANRRLREQFDEAVAAARKVGQYRLERLIGEGGMGQVYLAHHALLRRPTAIKLIRTSEVNDESIRRFEKEVQTTCQLTHPNTIMIYDYGRSDDGTFYYAMEYLEGCTLRELIEYEGALPPERAVWLLRQICGSLEEAHDRGYVHRDIKPGNIFVSERGGRHDFVKVLDFGLVEEAEATDANHDVGIQGTPGYLAPETVSGTPASPLSDIYAIGAIAYAMLTGEPAFPGDSPMQVIRSQSRGEFRRPRDINPSIPEEFEALIMACLETNPADRPESAAVIQRTLNEFVSGSHWSQQEAEAWWLEHHSAFKDRDLGSVEEYALTVDVRDRELELETETS